MPSAGRAWVKSSGHGGHECSGVSWSNGTPRPDLRCLERLSARSPTSRLRTFGVERCSTASNLPSCPWLVLILSFFFPSLDSKEPMSQLTPSSKSQLTQGAVGSLPNPRDLALPASQAVKGLLSLPSFFSLPSSWFSGSAALLFVDSPGTPAAQGSGRKKKRERKLTIDRQRVRCGPVIGRSSLSDATRRLCLSGVY
ncbi:hypothetical protein B0J18DRAFT_20965 [Chaetomium sp. MPI-SDFR-AT-0129]|nr:hypothetical protein B0J18DRAFT_20965 [Chaetomium sp. MPI-SDFR-AT-0129]